MIQESCNLLKNNSLLFQRKNAFKSLNMLIWMVHINQRLFVFVRNRLRWLLREIVALSDWSLPDANEIISEMLESSLTPSRSTTVVFSESSFFSSSFSESPSSSSWVVFYSSTSFYSELLSSAWSFSSVFSFSDSLLASSLISPSGFASSSDLSASSVSSFSPSSFSAS